MPGDILSLSKPEDLAEYSRETIDECRDILDEVVSASGPRTADNTLRPLNRLFIRLGNTRRGISLLRSVHPSAALRQAAERGEQDISAFWTEVGLHRGLYDAVRDCDVSGLDAATRRLHEHLLRDFHRMGVDRDEATRSEVRRLREELVQTGQEFARNILSDVRSIELDDPSELEGLPDDYVERHPAGDDGKIRITTDYPDYYPFMSYARSGPRREELYRAFRSRAYPENLAVLEKLLDRRHRLATLLGYASWADYAAEDKMIKTAASIEAFVARVSEAAEAPSRREYDELLERKRRDDPGAAEVFDWERGYYEEVLRKEKFDADSRELRPYLSWAATRDGILAIVSRLFEIEFRSAPDARRWHEDVDVVDVYQGGERAGRIYLDMHPREGKFKHAAMFPVVQGVQGGRLPEAALVCNFARPEGGGPALLEHDDVVTLFHEFGHILHHLLARDHEWVEFSGTATEWDFVEVPSQLFEEWAWDLEVLQGFAKHHRTGETIPVDVVERLRKAREFGKGLQVRHQMYYASLSLETHRREPRTVDVDRLERELQDRFSRFRHVEGTHFHASFGHLDSYSALYYTYMWSLVIEKDVFRRFKERGLFDRETARRYRESILEPGGSKDAVDLVRDFLGRDYGFEAFEEWLEGR